MCGIIAIAGKGTKKVSDSTVQSMLACLAKRGPDDQGFDRFDEALLGQTRLAIVDLSPAGHQPMRDNSGPFTIVFNGEIYDYKDLRANLEKRDHKFSSHSDTEVILKAYAEYGRDCVKYIDGMFAFALWDDSKKELFVARDRFGKKPFYYTFVDGLFIAASEIKSIFATNMMKGHVDPAAIDDYLRLMYIPSHKTVYSNIGMLPPAHAGIVKDGKIDTWSYWKLEKKPINISYEDAKSKIKELFDTAVKKRMIADVEIGSLLSGGVDSTIVTLYVQKYASFPIKTFSVGYEGEKNELPFALEASKKIGTEYSSLPIHANLAEELEKIIEYMDEPHGDTSNFPQHMISELAASKVKVALTGDGADELFMGYGWYQKKWHTSHLKADRWLLDSFQTAQKTITVFNEKERKNIIKFPVSNTNEKDIETSVVMGTTNPLQKINAFDLNIYLPGQLLSKIDRTSMMHSLEIRSPFLDTALTEFVYNLPTKFKLSKTENKIILKDILAETFPHDFVYRKKQGFGAPVASWLSSKDMIKLMDSLFTVDNPAFMYIDRAAALIVRNNYTESSRGSAQKLWVIICLLIWFKKHSQYHA
jgi:asparagine synthase (glutamine-hydrolysing)